MESTPDLTARQRQILQHIASGLANKQIAAVLEISEGTVEQHLYHIYRKLAVHSRLEAARWYWQHGDSKKI